jgi:tryptophan synthase beta subunit
VLQDEEGQITELCSISAGLGYPGVGPGHAYLHDIGRCEYRPVTDDAAMQAFRLLASTVASSRRSRAPTRSPAPSTSAPSSARTG